MELKVIKGLTLDESQYEHKFCFYGRGGLGDIICKYFGTGDGWEYLSSLKKKYPHSIVKYITFSANQEAPEFIRHHPYLDCILEGPWKNPNDECKAVNEAKGNNYRLLNQDVTQHLNLELQDDVYLNENDLKEVKDIQDKGPYIVLHPFAGTSGRMVMPINEYFPLIDMIAQQGMNTIVVGNDWERFGHPIKEEFPFEHPNLINLINKANSRVISRLVLDSYHLIAVNSFCLCLSKSGKFNMTFLASPNDKSQILNDNCGMIIYHSRAKSYLKNLGWKDSALSKIVSIGPSWNDFDKARSDILYSIFND